MIKSAFDRFRKGLAKTRDSFVGRLSNIFKGRIRLDPETLDQIEELLISADMGVKSSMQITQHIEQRLQEAGGEANLDGVLAVIREDVLELLTSATPKIRPPAWGEGETGDSGSPGKKKNKKKGKGKDGKAAAPAQAEPPAVAVADVHVILVVGVNGTGKTTSIAKLGALYKSQGKSVLLAAADTFRAAAVEQLEVWAERTGIPCVRQAAGADPAAVVYDAISAAKARGHDVVIVDTAGRLHTKTNLMAELGKMERVIEKQTGKEPETLLVVDANTGQNGLAQAKMFAETIPVEGLILTKLDGTAKGGIVVAIAETLGLPVRYVGMGETVDDLAVFDAESFVDALFADWQGEPAEE
ncbi:MAG: signal recognition particle-docking protein FtsY [bacterium]